MRLVEQRSWWGPPGRTTGTTLRASLNTTTPRGSPSSFPSPPHPPAPPPASDAPNVGVHPTKFQKNHVPPRIDPGGKWFEPPAGPDRSGSNVVRTTGRGGSIRLPGGFRGPRPRTAPAGARARPLPAVPPGIGPGPTTSVAAVLTATQEPGTFPFPGIWSLPFQHEPRPHRGLPPSVMGAAEASPPGRAPLDGTSAGPARPALTSEYVRRGARSAHPATSGNC